VGVTKQQTATVGWHWIAAVSTAGVLISHILLEGGGNPYVRAAGIVCLLLSPIFIFPPFLLLKRYGRPPHGKPYYCTTVVVDRGVYSIVRHPQYVGYVLFTLGFAALSQQTLTFALAVCSVGAFYVQSLREESFHRKQPGDDYSEYMRRVPRFNFIAGLFRHLFISDQHQNVRKP
jgi:protein-S-isoprenylcysteine O-methyltransferase Ste14